MSSKPSMSLAPPDDLKIEFKKTCEEMGFSMSKVIFLLMADVVQKHKRGEKIIILTNLNTER